MSKIYIEPRIPLKISVNLKDEKKFIINGRPLQEANRFFFNFQKGKLSDADNVAFHFEVRFSYMNEDNVIVTSYRKRGEWSTETTISNFPFSVKEEFVIVILVDADMYTVDVNDKEITRFQHQLPLQIVDEFYFDGDVLLSGVRVS